MTSRRTVLRALVAAGVAGATTWAGTRWLSERIRGDEAWERKNFRGSTVTLAAGPSVAAGAAAGIAAAPGVPPKVRIAGAATSLVIGAAGLYDDISGTTTSKGLHGHLSALRNGEVTSGVVKIGVIGAAGLAGAAVVSDNVADTLVGGAAIAGHANLLNLLDLRPGRAGKVVLLHAPVALSGRGGGIGAAAIGATIAALPDDLSERTMLGDSGANSLGGLLGLAMVADEGRRARLMHLAIVTALTLASEKVSFTKVIERTSWLRFLDELGRTPPP